MSKDVKFIIGLMVLILITTTVIAVNIRQEKIIGKQNEIIALQSEVINDQNTTIELQKTYIKEQEDITNTFYDIIQLHGLVQEIGWEE